MGSRVPVKRAFAEMGWTLVVLSQQVWAGQFVKTVRESVCRPDKCRQYSMAMAAAPSQCAGVTDGWAGEQRDTDTTSSL